jgi:hypothetical protein
LQLFARGWHIYEAGSLRVFHDTNLQHHESREVTSGVICNVGLYAFLHYPPIGWSFGLAQLGRNVVYCLRMGRIRGILSGVVLIPVECFRYRRFRNPVPWQTLKKYLRFRRTGVLCIK